ncbi:hypothetical protein JWG44_21580 [Leptospira sp. 201903071]|uniref:restriction endonuclease n=1 Tax=Leptospira ainazelensis TaxID=2810034 RepID=UPI0019649A76|nr:restriction endonuclease [Leptospira ainazelensis]MBM9502848.1 hypothetical protein [Leptospira ainazelensis]
MNKISDGRKLEEDFAKWAKRNLEYDFTELRTLVNGSSSARPYEVDIHGAIYHRKYELIRKFGIAGIILSIVAFLDIIPGFKKLAESNFQKHIPEIAGSTLITCGLIALGIWYFGKEREVENHWIECKDLKGKVKRKDVMKLSSSVDDVMENKTALWKPDKVIIVSSNGFDQDALAIAESKDIICYEKAGKGFKEVFL